VVVWLFAGGGEAEVKGLIPFLAKNFNCEFERKMPPRRRPGPRPNKGSPAHGLTGKSFVRHFNEQLKAALARGETCDMILVIDDLDCRDPDEQEQYFSQAIDSIPCAADSERCIGFAAPELEAWLIADWDNTFAKDVDFRAVHKRMQLWLIYDYDEDIKISFDAPETFSTYDLDRDTCQEKLSDAIIDSARENGSRNPYSKAIHTPRLLAKVNPETVSNKCPLFRRLYTNLLTFCSQ